MVSGVLSLPCTDEELETVCRLQIKLSVTSSLPFDLVLGRDWLQFIRDSLPNACFHLTSGPLDLRTRRGVFLGLRSNDMASHCTSESSPVLCNSSYGC
jgi:hypothetical protein